MYGIPDCFAAARFRVKALYVLTIYALSKPKAMRVVYDSIVYVDASCFGGTGLPYSIRSLGHSRLHKCSFLLNRVIRNFSSRRLKRAMSGVRVDIF